MTRLVPLLVIAFLTDLAAVFAARGVPFLCHKELGFGDVGNLLLTFAFGVVYVPAALLSHRLCGRFGERRCLIGTYLLDITAYVVTAALWRHPAAVFLLLAVLGATNGVKWPVLESYVSAGRASHLQARAIGLFNLSWAGSFPVALFGAGPIIDAWPSGIFLLPAGTVAIALAIVRTLPRRPLHLPEGDPGRLGEEQLRRWSGLRTSGRYLNLLSQAGCCALGALMPTIFQNLGFEVFWATGLSSLMDLTRFLFFIVLQFHTGWHGLRSPLLGGAVCLTAGFFMVVLGGGTGMVLAGEVLFGIGGAMSYYAALYYAMAVQNAAVEAGGVHEALIGLGAIIGPASGLAGVMLQTKLGGAAWGSLLGMGPMFAVCLGAVSWKLLRLGPGRLIPPAPDGR
jgi:hypothetical protein